jgi:hypothetical protein
MVYRAYTMFHGKTWDDIEIGYAYDLMKNWASDLIADHQLVGSIHIAYNEEVWLPSDPTSRGNVVQFYFKPHDQGSEQHAVTLDFRADSLDRSHDLESGSIANIFQINFKLSAEERELLALRNRGEKK